MPRIILHLDMDAFFAAIEQRDRPELRGQPVVIGSPPDKRGVVATASYEARTFGIGSAMPSRTAGQRCPHAVFLPPDMAKYSAVSSQVMAILRDVTPFVQPVSVDEAFLDITGALPPGDDGLTLARALQQRIRDDLSLTASIGLAPNKFLAKLASDMDKPDGLTVVPIDPDAILAWLAPLPVSRIWGVGEASQKKLHGYSIHTIADLQAQERIHLRQWFGPAHGDHLWHLARGLDDRPVTTEREIKSVSNEHTFDVDVRDPATIRTTLIRLTEKVGARLRKAGFEAGTAHLKLRYASFETLTRQQPLPGPTDSDRDLLHAALALLERESLREPIRLIGFGVSKLKGEDDEDEVDPQGWLFEEPAEHNAPKQESLDQAVDELRNKYGRNSIQRGYTGR